MFRGKQTAYEKDTKLLVKCITAFEDDEENFDLCKDYAVSNIKFHRFLAPDSHKIHRQITGLSEKFQIHSQNDKSKSFLNLVSKFLDSPVFELQEHGKTDTHYSILSLLLCLSVSPTAVSYDEPTQKKITPSGDSFDWTSYLLEDVDCYTGPFPDSPEWSDDDDDNEATDKKLKPRLTFDPTSYNDPINESVTEALVDGLTSSHDFGQSSCDWLRQNVVVQYWSRQGHLSVDLLSHQDSNLSANWELCESSMNSILAPSKKMLVTEHNIIRETLWMLMGVQCSVAYCWNGTQYTPNADLTLTHVTQKALSAVLSDLCVYGTLVRHLYDFMEEASGARLSRSHGNTSGSATSVCQTHQAFAAALSVYLQNMQQDLCRLERVVCAQEQVSTVASLLQDLAPHLAELDTLHPVYTNGIEAFAHVTSMSQKASGLLGAMFDALMESDNMGKFSRNKVSLLLVLWVKSCRPYLDIIDQWSIYGELVDPYKEFIIQRNIDIRSLDEHFWDTGFTLHCVETMSETEQSQDGTQPTANQLAPRFLLPVLDQIIVAGKSMELIENLGRLPQVLKGSSRKSLYEAFIESMESTLTNKTDAEETTNNVNTAVIATRSNDGSTIFKQNIAEQLQIAGVSDPLLRIDFINIFNAEVLQTESLTVKEDNIHRHLERLELDSLTPVQLLMKTCLYPQISKVSASLLQILKQEYHLMDYFAATRRYFLMEAGDLMYDFYTEIFEKLRLRESWQDVSFLNSSLQEALQARSSSDGENVYVSVESMAGHRGKRAQLVTTLDGLTLHYKVPWPIDIIINSRCLQVYNQVFSFLLQIKWVKYSLDELRFADLEKEALLTVYNLENRILGTVAEAECRRRAMIRRAQVMRMKLMHFINNLHNHIMTRILHSTGLEFEADMNEATDLDRVIQAHNTYVRNIHERCLLHKMVSIIKDIVTTVMNLALVLAFKWSEGITSLSESQLNDLESEFSRCISFLSSLLNKTIKRGSFPHLESLAFALVTSNEAMQPS